MLSSFSNDQSYSSTDVVVGDPIQGELPVLAADVTEIKGAGLLTFGSYQWGDSDIPFTISAKGFGYYEQLRQRDPDPSVAIEDEVRRYLDGTFKDRFPAAHERLAAAELARVSSGSSPQSPVRELPD